MSALTLGGTTSGTITLNPPAIAGGTVINLPAISGGSFIVSDSSGNVGIGTNSPTIKLDVQGTSNQLRVSTGAANSFYGLDAGAGVCTWKDFTDASEAISLNNAGYINFITASAERMRIDSSGNVGIGGSPNVALDVFRSSGTSVIRTTQTASGAGTFATIQSVKNGGAGAELIVSDSAGYVGTYNNFPFILRTNNTDRVTIDSSGYVSMGTSTTFTGNSLLTTLRGITAINDSTTPPVINLYNANAGTNLKTFRFLNDGSGNLLIQTVNDAYNSATSRAVIDSSGNFGFNSGYGSAATAYGCRAWVHFNGTGTVAILASGNVSSIGDGGVGNYTVNLANAMPDASYSAASHTAQPGTAYGYTGTLINNSSSFSVTTYRVGGATLSDNTQVFAAIFR